MEPKLNYHQPIIISKDWVIAYYNFYCLEATVNKILKGNILK